MFTRNLVIAALAFVASATFASEKKAEAANRYAMTEIVNTTNRNLTYSIKWGINGKWQQFYVAPGKSWIHHYRYLNVNQPFSPTLYILFDDDLGSQTNKLRFHTLVRYAGPEVSSRFSKKYKLTYDGVSGRFLDILGIN